MKIKGIELAPAALVLWALVHPIHCLANWGNEVLLIVAADEDDDDEDDEDDGGGSSRSRTYHPFYSDNHRQSGPHHVVSRHPSSHRHVATHSHATSRKTKSASALLRISGSRSKTHGKLRRNSGLHQKRFGITGSKSHHSVNARQAPHHRSKKTKHSSIHTKKTSNKGRYLKASHRSVAHKASHRAIRKSPQHTRRKPSAKVTPSRSKKGDAKKASVDKKRN